ncbi:RidA family protein [Thauera sinica]|uniref:RidA family protein n=1 Tax=Thauera sinica TaxID=2665146 RepID=A0ABW1AP03_9RHOO|nr:RidA family protein [Thauera sp. K11]ATE59449.1 enamine deaminase RidA [Thauera sp. K11]
METRVINPPELFVGKAFSQTFSVEGAQRLIFIAGQIDCDREGRVRNPDDLEAQLKGTLDNLDIALRAQGATMQDLVKVNFYIVGLQPAQTPRIRDIRAAYFDAGKPPAVTLVGIERLSMDGLLVEIEGIAAR